MHFDAIYKLVEDQSRKVNNLIEESLSSQVPLAIEISQHLIQGGGKRMRPLVLLLSAASCDSKSDKAVTLAAIVELIHTATLLHDDVVDHSSQRRGQSTANMVWGNAAPILVGDFLYSRAFQMMVSLESDKILKILAAGTNTIAEGEILQLANKHNPQLSDEDYEKIIYAKTAKLFEISAHMGAVVAQSAPDIEQALMHYGKHIGIAFQLMDDVLDYQAPSHVMGKNMGDDLADGKSTLPLLYALRHGNQKQKDMIHKAIHGGTLDDFDFILEAIFETGAIDFTLQRAKKEVEAAQACLSQLPDSQYKDALSSIANYCIERPK